MERGGGNNACQEEYTVLRITFNCRISPAPPSPRPCNYFDEKLDEGRETRFFVFHSISTLVFYPPTWKNCLFNYPESGIFSLFFRGTDIFLPCSATALKKVVELLEKEEREKSTNYPKNQYLLCSWAGMQEKYMFQKKTVSTRTSFPPSCVCLPGKVAHGASPPRPMCPPFV